MPTCFSQCVMTLMDLLKSSQKDLIDQRFKLPSWRDATKSFTLCFGRAFAFLGLCPPCLCCFAGKLFPLLWRERCHARFSALAAGGLPALSAHLAHHFGN